VTVKLYLPFVLSAWNRYDVCSKKDEAGRRLHVLRMAIQDTNFCRRTPYVKKSLERCRDRQDTKSGREVAQATNFGAWIPAERYPSCNHTEPLSRVLLEKLTVAHLVKKFIYF
jgi:hypothetical protein